jgi:hypothetical protein
LAAVGTTFFGLACLRSASTATTTSSRRSCGLRSQRQRSHQEQCVHQITPGKPEFKARKEPSQNVRSGFLNQPHAQQALQTYTRGSESGPHLERPHVPNRWLSR